MEAVDSRSDLLGSCTCANWMDKDERSGDVDLVELFAGIAASGTR